MCIDQVMSFRYAGKLYPDELEAVTAALSETGTKLIKDYSTNPMKGLLELGEHISSLRQRYLHLTRQTEATAEDLPESQGGPDNGTGE
jgi:hypothetical protein